MTEHEEELLAVFRRLTPAAQGHVLAFAQFLHSRSGSGSGSGLPATAQPGSVNEIPEPVAIPRPAEESVVKAVKRLAQTYPMLDKSKMLTDTSALVMQHVVQGRDAAEVIDELEIVFQRHYTKLKADERD